MNQYIYVVSDFFEKDAKLFSDLEQLENYQLWYSEIIRPKSLIKKIIKHIHISVKVNKYIKLPYKWIWYNLKDIVLDKNQHYVFIVNADVLCNYDISIFTHLKKKYGDIISFVFLLLDSVNVGTPVGEAIRKNYKSTLWDYIYTYDYNDALEYGFEYLNEQYFSKHQVEQNGITSDAYFIGALKPGREEKIINVFNKLKENNVKCNFEIVKHQNRTSNYASEGFNMLLNKKKYLQVLKETINTNCIVEILQDGQDAQTLRYFEAVCYNKKLLTNNKNITKLSFYNPKYMKFFEDIEDIDCEWIKKQEKVEYNYNGEFSPINFIKKLDKLYK